MLTITYETPEDLKAFDKLDKLVVTMETPEEGMEDLAEVFGRVAQMIGYHPDSVKRFIRMDNYV